MCIASIRQYKCYREKIKHDKKKMRVAYRQGKPETLR